MILLGGVRNIKRTDHNKSVGNNDDSGVIFLSKIKPVAVEFNGGKLTSDAGAVLLQKLDQTGEKSGRAPSGMTSGIS